MLIIQEAKDFSQYMLLLFPFQRLEANNRDKSLLLETGPWPHCEK